MRNKIITVLCLSVLLSLVTLTEPLMALEYSPSCFNGTILTRNLLVFKDKNGVTDNFTFSYNETCLYGCHFNQCQDPSFITAQSFTIFFAVFAVLMIVSAITNNKLFSLIAALILLIVSLLIVSEGFVLNQILYRNTTVRIIGIVFIMFSIFLIYSFGVDAFRDKKQQREIDDAV